MNAEQLISKYLNEAYFKVGDTLKSTVNAQGMKSGSNYEVLDTDCGPFGVIQYKVRGPDGKEFWIGNAHIVTSKVK